MAWPNTPFRTMSDGSTFWDAALGNALQAAINGVSTGNASLLGAVLDGVGGAASTPIAGALTLAGSAGGITAPTPAFSRGTIYKESGLFAGALINGGTSLVAGFNISAWTHAGAGSHSFALLSAASSATRVVVVGVLATINGFFQGLCSGTSTIICATANTAGTAVDTTFGFLAFHL
jgi:hypothetical protein